MNLEVFLQQYDEYLDKRLEKAWNQTKERLPLYKLPSDVQEFLKQMFVIGYELGSIEEEQAIKNLAKNDPVYFYEWLKSE